MSGGFPLGLEFGRCADQGSVTGTSLGTTLTSGAANTKGSYSQLVASSAIDASWILVAINNSTSANLNLALDIAVGAAAAEKDLLPNLIFSLNSTGVIQYYFFPCAIAAATRIAARLQSTGASDTCQVSVILFDSAFTQVEGYASVDSIGFTAGTTRGTSVDAGVTANTKGVYSQLIASTAADYAGYVIGLDSLASGTDVSGWGLLDIAIGGAGSEIVIGPNIPWGRAPAPGTIGPLWTPIPSGVRLAARAQCAGSTTPSRTIGVTLYGIRQ